MGTAKNITPKRVNGKKLKSFVGGARNQGRIIERELTGSTISNGEGPGKSRQGGKGSSIFTGGGGRPSLRYATSSFKGTLNNGN